MHKVDEVEKLAKEGEHLVSSIVDRLNELDIRPAAEFRRQSDWIEICVALALYARKKGIQEGVNNAA